MNQVFLWYEIGKYARNTFLERYPKISCLIEKLEILDLDYLIKKREYIKNHFPDNQNLQILMSILCKSCKISKILKCRPLTFKLCLSALKATAHLKIVSESADQDLLLRLLDKIKEDIRFCINLEDALNWYKLQNVIKKLTGNSCWNDLKIQIDNKLKMITLTEDKDKLIENLNFVLSFKPEIENCFEWLTKDIVDSTLKWIESEKAKLDADLSYVDAYENFEKTAEKLIGLIDLNDEALKLDQDTRDKINCMKMSLFKRENVKICYQSNNFWTSLMDDFESTELPIERIKKTELICRFSEYNEEGSIISAYKGWLDNSIPICIKHYHQKFSGPSNLFLKECKLFRYLSGKNQCFLEYKGWYKESSNSQDSKDFSDFAIVTEAFDSWLIDDIINHSSSNQKYTYQEYQKIVFCLLNAFSFLKSLEITHTNVKPHNILITENRMIKIAEFSFSERLEMNRPISYANDAYNLWKDNYTAPEIFELNEEDRSQIKSLDFLEKCDVYSLGLIFLQMYSLLPISELNTSPFWDEIDDYLSTFKPINVAILLRKMLAVKSAERASFKECLDIFMTCQVNKNEGSLSKQILEYEIELNPNIDVSNYLKDLEVISSSLIEFFPEPHYSKHLSKEVTVEFLKGIHNEKTVLIRTYRSKDFRNLLPYVKEAKLLKKLNGKHSTFIEYYGSMYSYKSCCEFSNITEWCSQSLISDITKRRANNIKYPEIDLRNYAIMVLEGLVALKSNFNPHHNIKPHNIAFSMDSNIKITGFFIPKAGIYSECLFPENFDYFIQNEEGYSSPESISGSLSNTNEIEKSDIFSLGLVFLQMVELQPVADWKKESFKKLQHIEPEWLSNLLQKMLAWSSGKRGNYDNSFKDMMRYINDYATIEAFKK